jgi:hypothetical protein
MDSTYFDYVTPTADTNTADQGIRIKIAGHYKISFNFIFTNNGYTGDNQYILITPVKNTSTTNLNQHNAYSDITEAGSTTRGNNNNTFITDFDADDYLKFRVSCAKGDTNYGDNLNKVKFGDCSYSIEFLGV